MGLLDRFSDTPRVQAFSPLIFICLSAIVALPPFALHLLLHPLLYLNPSTPLRARLKSAQSTFFYLTWRLLSPLLDPGDAPQKSPLLRKAYGTVLEPGAGVGDNIKYYVRSQVERLILVEPNTAMHPRLRAKANASGYFESDGSLLLLGCGAAASDEKALALAGVGSESVDCVMAIHVLCGIPGPAQAVELYRRLLKPGGLFAFFEHVRSNQREIVAWQQWYTKWIWPYAFDGCCLERQTGAWILGGPEAAKGRPLENGTGLVGGWESEVKRRWKDASCEVPKGQPRFSFLPHVSGWVVKA